MPICGSCQAKLDGPEMIPPWCAFNEVHPLELRHLVPPAGVLVEARRLPAVEPVETPPRSRSLAGRFFGALGRILGPGTGWRAERGRSPGNWAERGGSGADQQESAKVRMSRMRFKAPVPGRVVRTTAGGIP